VIRVTLSGLVFVYLATSLGGVLISWLLHTWRKRRREAAVLRHRLRCTICSLEFEDRTSTLLPRCPRCGSLNERFPFRAL
jgi:predicted Zn-ribbon and HTH transcriptional regulator